MEFYDRIKEQVAELTTNENYQNDGTAFGHFMIKECFNKIIDFEYDGNDFDQFIKDHIVDMANDLGNDAIFTNQANNEILVFQFKYSKNQLLNTNEIKKNKRFIDWIIGLTEEKLSANHKLKKLIDEELSSILTPENIKSNNFFITFYYIDADFIGNIKTDINALHTNYKDKKINFDIRFYNYQELEELYDDIEIPKNEVELRFVGNEIFSKNLTYYDNDETQLETVVTSIYANSLKPIIEDKKELILALNVRYYKGENDINSKIKKEYSKGEKSNFWILNNGINGVCQDFTINDNNTLTIKNFQIVNGGQTAKTLTRIVNDLPDNVQILLRLTKVKDKARTSKISMDIAVASNSQNAISARDLHSGDRIQNKIFEHLNNVGVFYDKKDGEWATVNKKKYRNPFGKSPMHLKIRNLDLGVSYLSFYLQLPISTVGRHKLVFSELYYDRIFDSSKNEDDQFYKLILAYRIAERINDIKGEKYNNYEILWNNYINDVLLSLSALYFFQDKLHKIDSPESLISELSTFKPNGYVNQNERFTLTLETEFDDFAIKTIKALQYYLDVKKQAKKEYVGEEWLPNDTNKWLKKDGTYKGIFEAVIKKLKEE
tara:strand:- start:966 stop:2777 length:1812 start_codon:yes stop_codon:yes gene_type:complete